jgi:membrane protease YdiL (CAAX protease family)
MKKNVLVVDNQIDILGLIITAVAIIVLFNLFNVFSGSDESPQVASDSLTLILTRGIPGIAGMFFTRLFLCSNKGKQTPIVGNQWGSSDKDNSLMDSLFATACYFGIQISILVLEQKGLFQVSAVDVYAFFISAAVLEECFYRGFLVMLCQALLAKVWKARDETSILIMNVICCLLSGIIFAAAHTRYYGEPALMLITFLGGCSQAWWYLKSKNLFVPIVSHAFINFAASGGVVQTL